MEELQTFVEDQNFKQSLAIEPDLINADHSDSHHERTPKNLEKSASFKVSHADTHSTNSHRRTLSDYNQYVHFLSTAKIFLIIFIFSVQMVYRRRVNQPHYHVERMKRKAC